MHPSFQGCFQLSLEYSTAIVLLFDFLACIDLSFGSYFSIWRLSLSSSTALKLLGSNCTFSELWWLRILRVWLEFDVERISIYVADKISSYFPFFQHLSVRTTWKIPAPGKLWSTPQSLAQGYWNQEKLLTAAHSTTQRAVPVGI